MVFCGRKIGEVVGLKVQQKHQQTHPAGTALPDGVVGGQQQMYHWQCDIIAQQSICQC
jgi:hypothetical protein